MTEYSMSSNFMVFFHLRKRGECSSASSEILLLLLLLLLFFLIMLIIIVHAELVARKITIEN